MPPSAMCRRSKLAHRPMRSLETHISNSSEFPIDHLFWALDSFNIGIAVIDRRLRFRAVNRALAAMHVLPANDHVGRPLHKVVGSLVTKVGSALEHVLSTGKALANVKISGKLPRRGGPGQWIDYYFPLSGSSSGHVTEVGVFVSELEARAGRQVHGSTPATLHEGGLHRRAMVQPDFGNQKADGAILSEREREVLGFLATGKCNKEISSILAISVKTVETYRCRVMLKLQAPSLVHLVHYAIAHGIVDLRASM
jgi:DNA-binding CsgD family transcriptional regulator